MVVKNGDLPVYKITLKQIQVRCQAGVLLSNHVEFFIATFWDTKPAEMQFGESMASPAVFVVFEASLVQFLNIRAIKRPTFNQVAFNLL